MGFMARIIDPPLEHFELLPTPLTKGERAVIDLFNEKLPPEWEIYVQPHLNGVRPDVVLLNPSVGIAVFEIKDWDMDAMHYYAQPDESGSHVLMAREKNGDVISLESKNPVNKILLYKEELGELYCPRLDALAGSAVITAGIIFPCARRSEVERVFGPFRNTHLGMREYPQYYPMASMEDIASGDLSAVFPESNRRSSKVMSHALADDLRGWLKEPYFSQEQRNPLVLDERQRYLAENRTDTGFRRIMGPAGSGKSVVLAARAATLADQGKRVLVVTFNITLLNYLRDLAVRHVAARRVVRRQIDFLNFHRWCKRVCDGSGHTQQYKRLWASASKGSELQHEPVLNEDLAALVQELYQADARKSEMPRYDAILVDEGQDFRPSWWNALKLACEPRGEMVLVADKTQNIYGTAAAWTEETMANAGFRGPWSELKISYRLPPKVFKHVCRFAEEHLTAEEVNVPEVESTQNQLEFEELYPAKLRWVQVNNSTRGLEECLSELQQMMTQLKTDTAIPDITILSGNEMGRQLTQLLADKGINVLHTFDWDTRKSTSQKRAFFQGVSKVKATTLQSFKGWESRHLLLYVDRMHENEDRALIYTALTRIQRHENGSCLTVVSSCPELKAYGQSWPDFTEK